MIKTDIEPKRDVAFSHGYGNDNERLDYFGKLLLKSLNTGVGFHIYSASQFCT